MKFKAFIGVRFAENLSDSEWQNTFDEIENLSNYYTFHLSDDVTVKNTEFQFSKHPRSIYQVKDRFHWFTTDKILIIKFTAPNSLDPYSVVSIFEKRLRDLIIGISIAKKGGIDIGGEPIVFLNNKYLCNLDLFIHSLDLVAQQAKNLKWPKLRIVDLRKTIDWLNRYQSETDGMSGSSIGRALNAFSYLFKTRGGEGDGSQLFWAMVAIEAIYTEGNASILSQINLKTQILLGKRLENKKRFNAMYDFRSRFVHGDLNFNNKYLIKDNYNEINDHWAELYENQHIAISIVLATFQNLIKRNKNALDFDYVLKKTPPTNEKKS